MELVQAGIDRSLIAIWLGHESLDSTQIYLDANLALKEEILAKIDPLPGKPSRYRPDEEVGQFHAAHVLRQPGFEVSQTVLSFLVQFLGGLGDRCQPSLSTTA